MVSFSKFFLNTVSSLLVLSSSTSDAAILSQKGPSGSIAPVIKLLNDMKQENIQESAESRKIHDEVEANCAKTHTEAVHRIEFLTEKKNTQVANSEEMTARSEKADEALQIASSNLQKLDKEIKDSKVLFKEKKETFRELDKEAEETIDMVSRALRALQNKEKELEKSEGGEGSVAFLQNRSLQTVEDALDALTSVSLLDLKHKDRIASFLLQQSTSQSTSQSQPVQATTSNYDSKMGPILELFEDFLAKQQASKSQRQQEWGKEEGELRLVIQGLEGQKQMVEQEITRQKEVKGQSEVKKANADGKVQELSAELKDTEKILSDNKIDCKQANDAFERKSVDFKNELAAVSKAIEILSKAPGFIQTNDATTAMVSFVQVSKMSIRMNSKAKRSSSSSTDQLNSNSALESDSLEALSSDSDASKQLQRQTQAAIFLNRLVIKKFPNNLMLQQLASRAQQDPFAKVKSMIDNMIKKLNDESKVEANKHEYCQMETKKSSDDVENKKSEVDKISSRLEDREAEKMDLTKTIKKQNMRLSEIEEAMGTMTKVRNEEKKENLSDIKTASMNEQACSDAISALQEFYSKSSEEAAAAVPEEGGEALVQTKSSARDADSVIYLLQQAEAEYAKASADTKASENTAQREFEKEIQDLRVEKSALVQGTKDNSGEITRINTVAEELSTDLDNANKELNASSGYAQKIEEECSVKVPSFEEKQKLRKDEIAGLEEALKILAGEQGE